jgi:hypothetical protein
MQDRLRAGARCQATSRTMNCFLCMYTRRLDCLDSRSALARDGYNPPHQCRLPRLHTGTAKVTAERVLLPRDLRCSGLQQRKCSAVVLVAEVWAKQSGSVEVVIRLGWTREERIGMEQSSWLITRLLFEQESFRSMKTQGNTVAERRGKETMSVCFLKSSGRARVPITCHLDSARHRFAGLAPNTSTLIAWLKTLSYQLHVYMTLLRDQFL